MEVFNCSCKKSIKKNKEEENGINKKPIINKNVHTIERKGNTKLPGNVE